MIDSVVIRLPEYVVEVARIADNFGCSVIAVFPTGYFDGRGLWRLDGMYVMLIKGTIDARFHLGEALNRTTYIKKFGE